MIGSLSMRTIVVLVVLGAIWGAAFMLVKISVAEIPPVTLVAVRLVIAATILVVVLYSSGLQLPTSRAIWRDFFVVGSLGLALPFVLISWGQQFIPSSLTAILNAAVPLFSAILAYFWTGEERMTGGRLLGLLLGFVGVVVAVGIDRLRLGGESTQGVLAVLAATFCFALTGLYGRRAFRGMPALVPAAGQLTAGALLMIPLALVLRDFPTHWPALSTIAALLALAAICTALAYILLYWLLDRMGATRSSMVTYLIAPFGLLYGALLLHEEMNQNTLIGLLLVFAGILFASRTTPLRPQQPVPTRP